MEVDKEVLLINLKKLLKAEIEEKDSLLIFKTNGKLIKLNKTELDDAVRNLEGLQFDDNICLSNANYFEQLVKVQSGKHFLSRMYFSDSNNIKEDVENGLIYDASKPSLEYLFALLLENLDVLTNSSMPISFIIRRTEKKEINLKDFFETWFKDITLKIKSREGISVENFSKLCISYLFHINYNSGIPLVALKFVEIKDDIRRSKIRRTSFAAMNVPKRSYDSKLVYYYQQALSTDSAVLKYLSYYNIIEFFFNEIAEGDLIEQVILRLTEPSFSHKRKDQIRRLIKLIKGSEYKYTEENMLRLVLIKFLDFERLIEDLNEFDKNYFNYLKENKVQFANAERLDDSDIINTLTKRIYAIRNALVHSKEGEKPKFEPFSKDEEELKEEILLIQLISEQIIIKNSTTI